MDCSSVSVPVPVAAPSVGLASAPASPIVVEKLCGRLGGEQKVSRRVV